MQVALFDLEQKVQVIKQGVDQANVTLSTMAIPGSACQDFDCALFQGASLEEFKELVARGAALPENGTLVMPMSAARWPHRFDVVALYLAQGHRNLPFVVLRGDRPLHLQQRPLNSDGPDKRPNDSSPPRRSAIRDPLPTYGDPT